MQWCILFPCKNCITRKLDWSRDSANMIFFPLCVHERKSYVNGRRVSGNHVCTVYYQILQGSQNRWVLEEFCFYIFKISYRFLCFKTRMIRCLEAEGSPIVGWDFFRIGLSIAVCLVVGRPFATWAIKARMNTVWKAQLISKPYARVRLCLKKKWEKALEIMTNPFYFTRARAVEWPHLNSWA